MALTGKLVADFASFYDAVNKAQVELKSFQTDAAKVGSSLDKMANSFSGKNIIQQATLMVDAVEKIGGTAHLTEREMERLGRTVQEAVAKMKAIGADVPKNMQAIADATAKTVKPAQESATAFSKMGVAIGSFVGNLAANLFQQGVSSLVNLATSAVATAGKIDDLSKKLGISAEAVQGFQYAAEQTGTTVDAFGSAINKLNINLAEGDKSTVKALEDLGLTFTDIRAMKPEDAFLAIADALQAIQDPMERARLGTELMGKGFVELTPAIVDGLRDLTTETDKMSNETVKRLADAEDAWAKLANKVTILSGEAIAGAIGTYEELARKMARIPSDAQTAMERAAQNMEASMVGVSEVSGVPFRREVTGNIEDLLDARLKLDALPPPTVTPKVDEGELKRQQQAIDALRKSIEGLGLVTTGQVNAALKDFAAVQRQAATDGLDVDRVLAAQLPKLADLVKKAEASGTMTRALALAYQQAGDAWRRSVDPLFDVASGTEDLAAAMAHLTPEAERLNRVMSPAEWSGDLASIFADQSRELERMNQIMSPEEWNAARAADAMKRLGVDSQAALDALAREAARDYEAIVASGETSADVLRVAWQRMIDAQKRASGELPTYWERVVVPSIEDALHGIASTFSQTMGEMLADLRGWKEGFVSIWNSIKQAFANIVADMLNTWLSGFINKLVGSLLNLGGGGLGKVLGGATGALGGLFGGGSAAAAAAFGVAPAASSAAGAAGLASLGWTLPGGTAAGGGAMAGLGAFLTNPFTIGAAGAAILGLGIWKKGWFRGGEEALRVNPARDQWFDQFVAKYRGQYSPYESLVRALEESGVVGDKASNIIRDIYGADTMKEYNAAVEKATEALEKLPDAESRPNQTINVNPGAIVVNGADRDPYELAREIAAALADVIVRENPGGSRTILRNGLA